MRFDSSSSLPLAADVAIQSDGLRLEGSLTLPADARGLVLFAHGSGSSRHSPRNRHVAGALQSARLGTLLFDLLTRDEERIDDETAQLRFDIPLLAARLRLAAEWTRRTPQTASLRLGYFGASTGAAAALVAAADPGSEAGAVVSRGGRPDLAGAALSHVRAPTLLIVGGADEPVISLNEQAYARLRCPKQFEIVPGATHLFEEPGALETIAALAAQWFAEHLSPLPVAPR
jgi:putative phosphoribosyl transferase